MERTTLKIDGMSCGHCVRGVTKALEAVDGVTVDEVAIGRAVITHGETVTPQQLAAAVDDAGYHATPVTRAG